MDWNNQNILFFKQIHGEKLLHPQYKIIAKEMVELKNMHKEPFKSELPLRVNYL